MKTRRGFTLIEILVAVTAGTVVLAAVVALLHTLLRADRANRDAMHREAAVERLSQQFRDDVHAAVRVAASPPEWRLDLPDGRSVVYRVTADGISRTETTAGAAANGQLFPLPPDVAARIETAAHGGPTLVGLVIAAASDDAAQPPSLAPLRIDAVLASDHRFTGRTFP